MLIFPSQCNWLFLLYIFLLIKIMKLIKNFIIPHKFNKNSTDISQHRVVAIIPSFKPKEITIRLVNDLLRFNNDMRICVVDDSTPEDYELEHRIFERIRTISERVIVLRTPENKLKAGAINQGLNHLLDPINGEVPDVILTLDDDVIISEKTVCNLVSNLFEDDRFGAVCSQCRVMNKDKNILTRLQSLEYFGFNILRLADEGFFFGPLVMHGMLTAFKAQALKDAEFFAEQHLIEDYEITAKMKKKGWHVRLASHAYAWTEVPENLKDLWRQRTRWTLGGIFVITEIGHWKSVIQDIIGHILFSLTFIFIVLSLIFYGEQGFISNNFIRFIVITSFVQTFIWYVFQVWFTRFYKEGDWKDWLIRLTLLPEFIYANFLSVILVGSYLFYFFHILLSWVDDNKHAFLVYIRNFVHFVFAKLGYSKTWGTRR